MATKTQAQKDQEAKEQEEREVREQQEYEDEFVADYTHANEIAVKLFGEGPNVFATQEIFDYLQRYDEETFAADLKKTIGFAKIIYSTETPTPEMVFGMFTRLFIEE